MSQDIVAHGKRRDRTFFSYGIRSAIGILVQTRAGLRLRRLKESGKTAVSCGTTLRDKAVRHTPDASIAHRKDGDGNGGTSSGQR
jgi:hypothetical protein